MFIRAIIFLYILRDELVNKQKQLKEEIIEHGENIKQVVYSCNKILCGTYCGLTEAITLNFFVARYDCACIIKTAVLFGVIPGGRGYSKFFIHGGFASRS